MATENSNTSTTLASSTAPNDRDFLRRIAAALRHITLAIICFFCLIPVNLVLGWIYKHYSPWGATISLIIMVPLFVFGASAVYRLATLCRNKAAAVLYVLALPIPIIGLIPFFMLCNEATNKLKANGIAVDGMLGANPNDI